MQYPLNSTLISLQFIRPFLPCLIGLKPPQHFGVASARFTIAIANIFLYKKQDLILIPGNLKLGAWAALRLTATILMALLYLNASIPKEFFYFDV
ncbi:MAG: hypothetical protein RBT11_18270 [Desulfobacterales bacterium]|nr:hypothetical protein [Desulfobacterales bacterium]